MTASGARISLLIASLLGALPFLFPEHRPPILSFYDEWLAFALTAGALLASAFGARGRPFAVPELSLWFVAFAVWLAVQAVLREPAFAQLPLAGAVYLLAAAGAAWLGHELARNLGASAVVDVLAAIVLAGACANAAIGIAQLYGIPRVLEGIIARTSGPRIVGHVGQANLFAAYLALGQASLVYLVGRARLSAVAAWSAGALLVLAGAYSGSRSALAFAVWIAALALVTSRRAGQAWRPMARCAVVLAGSVILATFVLPWLHHALSAPPLQFAIDRQLDPSPSYAEVRPDAWLLALRLFVRAPWLGVGWGEFGGAAFEAGLPPALAATNSIWTSPHNAPLQILAEAGIPGAALALIAAVRWWLRIGCGLSRSPTLADWWIAAAAGTICLHAMVEYPLWYAHVLLLLALLGGIASRRALAAGGSILRPGIFVAGATLALLLAWTLVDYVRFDGARVTASGRSLAPHDKVDKAVDVLRATQKGPLGVQVTPWLYRSLAFDRSDLEAKLDLGARAIRCRPEPTLVARHSAFLALAGRRDEALDLMARAAASYPGLRAQLSGTLRPLAAIAPEAVEPLVRALGGKR